MDQIELKADKREVLGKKVRFLRRQGIIPVHLFGHGIESLALQCDSAKLEQTLAQAGHTKLIRFKVAKERKTRSVVIREFHRDWRDGVLMHVDFYQVKMEEKIKVEVPIVLVGEAPVLKLAGNTLVHEIDNLSIECLPADIPSSIELDVSSFTDPEQMARVKDIKVSSAITVLADPELVVVKISSRPGGKVEEEVAAPAIETPESHDL